MKNITLFFLVIFISLVTLKVSGQGISVIDSLKNALELSKEDTSKVNTLFFLAWETSKNDPEKAVEYAKQGLKIAEKLPDNESGKDIKKRLIADSKHQLAWANYVIGNIDTALKYNLEALKIREEINYEKGIANSLNNIGNISRQKSEYQKSLEYYTKSLKLYEALNLKNRCAVVLGNIGLVYYDLGNHPKALEYYYRTVRILEELGDSLGLARNLGNIGIVFKDEANYETALEYYFRSLKIHEKINYKGGISKDYGNIGVVYRNQGDYKKALEYYFKALEIDKEIPNKGGIARHLSNIGVVYGLQQQNEQSLDYFLRALKMEEEMGNKNEIARKKNNIGSLYNNMGEYQKAHEYLDSGIVLARRINAIDIVRDGYLYKVSVDSAEGNFIDAFEHYKLYALFRDSIISRENLGKVAEIKTAYETEEKEKEIKLLNQENENKALILKNQQTEMLALKLEEENKRNKIILLSKENALKEVELKKGIKELANTKLDADVNRSQVELLIKEKELRNLELDNQKIIKNFSISLTVLLVIIGGLAFSRFRQRQYEKRMAERMRISGDLHDDFGSNLSKITLLGEVVKRNSVDVENIKNLEKIIASSRETLERMSEVVWTTNPHNDKLESFFAYIRKYAHEYLECASIACKINVTSEIPKIFMDSDQRRNVFLCVKEALHNIIKHSKATHVKLDFIYSNQSMEVTLHDNGKGINLPQINMGNGLNNMKRRMEAIGGKFLIEENEGTKVRFIVKLT